MKIIRHRYDEEVTSYDLQFGFPPGDVYFGFACDEKGNVDESKLHPAAVENYKQLMAGTKQFDGKTLVNLGVRKYSGTVWHHAIGICDVCEKHVDLTDPMTNTCDCGAEYNGSGQRLEDRRLWDGTDGATSPDYE